MNVLNNDIGNIIDEADTLSTDNTLVTHTDNTLVALDVDGNSGRNVVSDLNGLVVIAAPVRTVESVLSRRTAGVAGGYAARLGGLAFGLEEIICLVEHDDSRCVIGQPLLESVR